MANTAQIRRAALVGFFASAAACDAGVVESERTPVASVEVSPAEVRAKIGNSVQLEVVLSDAAGNPLTGRQVYWATEDDAIASVSPAGLVTGKSAGTVQIAVSSEGKDDIARVTVHRPVPSRLVTAGGDGQTGTVDRWLPDPLVVRVVDGDGDPVPDVAVTWRGDGELDPATSSTDEDGRARSVWTLGTGAGPQRAEASLGSLRPAAFAATAAAGPPSEIRKIDGDGQRGCYGRPLEDPLVVEIRDEYGNPVEGGTVTWVIVQEYSAGGSFSPPESTTDADGRAATEWTLGSIPGLHVASVSAGDVRLSDDPYDPDRSRRPFAAVAHFLGCPGADD